MSSFLVDRYFLVPLQLILPQNNILSRLLLRCLKKITSLITRKTQLHRLVLSEHPDTPYYFNLLFRHRPVSILEKKVPLDLLPKVIRLQEVTTEYQKFKEEFLERCKSMEGIDFLLEEIKKEATKLMGKGGEWDWTDLGFQGSDPKTDVRSTGIASLHHFRFLLNTHPETITRALTTPYSISFACIVINCTAYLRDLLMRDSDRMNYFMLSSCGKDFKFDERLGEAVNEMLVLLEDEWARQQPADIMGFPSVFTSVKQLFP